MNKIAMMLALTAGITCVAFGYEPQRHNDTFTTNGITYAQRGGLGAADYVVTKIDDSAVGKVTSVNGKEGDVVIDANSVGAVARDADYLAVCNAAMGAVAEANAYTDASISETNEGFVAAVTAVSPPVELPQKWALSNVTNKNGEAVSAEDVGALRAFDYTEYNYQQNLLSANSYTLENGDEVVYEPSIVYSEKYSSAGEGWKSARVDNKNGIRYYEMQQEGASWIIPRFMQIYFGSIAYGFGVNYEDKQNGIYSTVFLRPNSQGYFATEGWDSLSRTLQSVEMNAVDKAACADALEKISESKPHFAVINGELHIISITNE